MRSGRIALILALLALATLKPCVAQTAARSARSAKRFDQRPQGREGNRIQSLAAGSMTGAPSHKAIYQFGLASAVVGWSSTGSPIGYRMVLLVTVPANVEQRDEMRMRALIGSIVNRIGYQLQKELDALPGLEEAKAVIPLSGETVGKHFAAYATNTFQQSLNAYVAAVLDFNQNFKQSFARYAADSTLAIAIQPCGVSECDLDAFAARPRNRSTDRFGKLYGWLKANGLKSVNCAYVLDGKGSFASVAVTLDHGYEWRVDFPKTILQQATIAAVNRARRTQSTLSYSAAELSGLTREAAAHIADVFDSAYAAAADLPSSANSTLPGVSDEIGRARILECVRLRGAFAAAEAGACAGYRLTQRDIAMCISGNTCEPSFGDRINVESLTIRPHASTDFVAFIAQNTFLPRIVLGGDRRVSAAVNACKGKFGEQAGDCLVGAALMVNPQSRRTLECIGRESAYGMRGVTECAVAEIPQASRAQLACFQKNYTNYKGLALCVAKDSLPATAQKFIDCASRDEGANLRTELGVRCLGVAGGPREAACLADHPHQWQDAAFCIAGDHLPRPAQDAIACSRKSTDLTGFGVCVVAQQGDGEAQRIAACYVEGQGIPSAIAVCLAEKDLTQDQRIVLECAAATNGSPHGTAACAGGKMAMREMMNCRGRSFGEGNCFGENNELRKIARAFGTDIGPHSVVGDIVNAQLTVINTAYAPIINEASAVLPQVAKVLPDVTHPTIETVVLGPPGQMIGNAVQQYCAHNSCDFSEIAKTTGIADLMNKIPTIPLPGNPKTPSKPVCTLLIGPLGAAVCK